MNNNRSALSPMVRPVFGGLLLASLLFSPSMSAGEKAQSAVQHGKQLSLALCQACHYFEGTNQAGTLAPPFLVMKQRFPDPKRLHDIIYDPQAAIKPSTMMPPFGRHEFVNEQDIKDIVEYLYTL